MSAQPTSPASSPTPDVVLDGTDNFTTRYLINDACVKLGKPWVYTGVIASYGMTMTIRPGETACLRCIMGELPAPGTVPTCDTAGIIGPIVSLMGSIAVAEALKLLVGTGTLNSGMIHIDLWDDSFDKFDLGGPRPDCPTCGQHEYIFLNAEAGARTTRAVRSRRGAGERAGRADAQPAGAGRTLARTRRSARSRSTRICCVRRSTATSSPSFPMAARSSRDQR